MKSYCKLYANSYRRERVMCLTSHIRNSYYTHLKSKKHLSVAYENIFLIGKICSKCKIDKPKDSFHNDKYEEGGKKSICKECKKSINNRKIISECGKEISYSNKTKHDFNFDLYKCISCNRIITKSNKLNHENTVSYK